MIGDAKGLYFSLGVLEVAVAFQKKICKDQLEGDG